MSDLLLPPRGQKATLYPCPRCHRPYSFVDPAEWHVDPHVCRQCRDELKAMNTKPIIFMVGPDMCGKTQIAKELSTRLNVPYYKAAAEHGAFLSKKQKRFIDDIRHACPARLDLLKQVNTGVVYDRGYPCEYVYSRFFDRKSDDKAVFWLDEQYAALSAVIVITTRKSFVGIKDDLDDSIGPEQLEKLSLLYDEFASKSKCRILKLFVDDENLDKELADIEKFMKEGSSK